jgi:WD40 repeat protein
VDDTSRTHPAPEELAAFGLGRLDTPRWQEIEQHVRDCPSCGAALRDLPDDEFVRGLRDGGAGPDRPGESVAHVRGEGPTATAGGGPSGGPVPADVPAWLSGHSRYRVLGVLGAGGMGVVYRAEHLVMARPVALKVMHRGLLDSPAAAARFVREARAAARLAHPHIVAAYDAEEAGDHHLLVMEYVEGMSLARLVAERGPLPVRQACDYVRQAALGLQHAHEQGMVHRDIKPQNLMLTPGGVVKVLDFGLARFALESAPAEAAREAAGGAPAAAGFLTQAGLVVGTPDFLAPEQARDAHTADVRADIYSLGCTLYYLLAGRVPFPEDTAVDKLLAHASRPPRPLAEVRPDLPAGVVRVVEKMTAKDPARRYQAPAEVAEALAPFAGNGRSVRRWGAMAAGVVLALGVLGYLTGPGVVRFAQSRGQLDFDSEDPESHVLAASKTEQSRLLDLPTGRRAELDAGEYQLRLLGGRPDLRLVPEAVTVPRGGRVTVQVRQVPEFVGEVCCCQGHQGAVEQVAFSPDGRFVLSSSGRPDGDKTLRLWDAATGREVRCFRGHEDQVTGIALSPDGRRAVSGSLDGSVRLWDVATGKELRRLPGHKGGVAWVAYSPDNRHALSAGLGDKMVRLWDLKTGEERRVFAGHTEGVICVAFSADGRQALSGGFDKTMRLWDVATGQELRRFPGHLQEVSAVAFSPDGRRALSASDDLRLWDVATGRELRHFQGYPWYVYAAALSPDGRRALSGGPDSAVTLWDAETGEELCRLEGHTNTVSGVAFSPDGRRAASAGEDRTVRLWKLPEPGAPRPAPDRLAQGEVRRFTGHRGPVKTVAFSPDGRRALSGSGYRTKGDYTMRLWDIETGRQLRLFAGHEGFVQSVAFSPDGRRALSGGVDHTMRLWDLDTGAELRRFTTPNQSWVNGVVFCPDGRHALSGGSLDNLLRLWDLDTGKEERTYQGHADWIGAVAISPDGRRALSGGGPNDAAVCVWEVETGRRLHRLAGHTAHVEGVAFSPDGRYALSGGGDGTVRLWDLETGREVARFEGHEGSVLSVAFSPDGSRVLSGGWDQTVRLWDVRTRKELRVFRGHTDAVWSVTFAPDGRRALSGSGDRTLRLWDVTPPDGSR